MSCKPRRHHVEVRLHAQQRLQLKGCKAIGGTLEYADVQ